MSWYWWLAVMGVGLVVLVVVYWWFGRDGDEAVRYPWHGKTLSVGPQCYDVTAWRETIQISHAGNVGIYTQWIVDAGRPDPLVWPGGNEFGIAVSIQERRDGVWHVEALDGFRMAGDNRTLQQTRSNMRGHLVVNKAAPAWFCIVPRSVRTASVPYPVRSNWIPLP